MKVYIFTENERRFAVIKGKEEAVYAMADRLYEQNVDCIITILA